ncbi:outer membrane protein OmpA-like peptidoglycan-associated protein [Granulicella aggregans]|uniref:Outer membrane protein OmpA-like peptidoglycan-associated protein n=2 Tax=Granulicella aggregans TaxID=474949 RepID=A0A7W7ZB81_9BACT|nr:outer membrane protein OmpA-like peptidoglycan-associated protein [Granulicella aggregans]
MSTFTPLALAAVSLLPITSTPFAAAQEQNPTANNEPRPQDNQITQQNGIYIYRVKVVQRDLDAVNYLHRSGSTTIGFEGTALLPLAKGEAKVESQRGGITIDASFKGLTPANGFGPEYLTYVLWAITPDGRPANLGEVLPSGNKNTIHVTTAFQSFGLIVTAEPYYSVSQPSDVVVMQNVIKQDKTTGVLEKVNAHYTLLPRGLYAETDGAKSNANPITRDMKSPLEIYEAHNAFRIAQSVGADKYSPDIMREAAEDLKNADDMDSNKHGDRKMEITFARQVVQRSEDARIDTLRKQAAERQRNADLAQQQAQKEAAQSAADAQQSQLAAAQAQAAKEKADAERARAEADAADARARAAEATKAANQSVADANAIRERLKAQLNSVLQTNETARGLIVNMSDVLFDTGKYTLKPGTQVALAKVSGILAAYPSLKLQVEGYTDIVGGDAYNQKLSENRAGAVKDFLVSQGVSINNITAAGYGKANPVADNGTAAGRAQNRRVQLVVSGDAIGVQQSGPDTAAPQQ